MKIKPGPEKRWWKCQFDLSGPFTGPITYSGGQLGTAGESVVVNGPPCCDCVNKLGDINGDGFVDLLDVDPFVQLLQSGKYQCEADVNSDMALNLLDLPIFVAILTGG